MRFHERATGTFAFGLALLGALGTSGCSSDEPVTDGQLVLLFTSDEHNAAPLTFLKDDLAAGTPAMMSTQEGPGNYRNDIPRSELLTVVEERHMPCARSDVGSSARPMARSPWIPQDRWIDCSLPC